MPALLSEISGRDFLIEIEAEHERCLSSFSSISFIAGGRKNLRNQTLQFILSSATNILHDLRQISALLLVTALEK